MKANELRQDNILLFYDGTDITSQIEVKEIKHNCVSDGNYDYYYQTLHPIPLTEEWLIRLGFEKAKRGMSEYYYLDDFQIEIHGDKYVLSVWGGESAPHLTKYFAHHTKHVHQLQNIYFAITGKELKLKQ